jgi:hypothetical protein
LPQLIVGGSFCNVGAAIRAIGLPLLIVGCRFCNAGAVVGAIGLPLLIVGCGFRNVGAAVGAIGFLRAGLQAHGFAALGKSFTLIDRELALGFGLGDGDISIGDEL